MGWFFILGPSLAYADDPIPAAPEQVVVSPAQQAVNTALSTAVIEVTQAAQASDTATATVAKKNHTNKKNKKRIH